MTTVERILEAAPTILVVGDVILDHFIYGKVERISPEAPVPVVSCETERDMLGGCGNVVRNIRNLGADARVVATVGSDSPGEIVIRMLTDLGVMVDGILRLEKVRTTHKMRIVAESQHIVRVDWDTCSLEPGDCQKLIKKIQEVVAHVDGVIISDYGKGVCRNDVVQTAIRVAKERNIPVFVDPKGTDWQKYEAASYITPNTREAQVILNRKLDQNEDFINAAEDISTRYSIDACLITRGKDGITFRNHEMAFYIPSIVHEVFDVSGAGDTVIASLAAARCSGVEDRSAVEFANKAAGIVVGHVGTAAITIEDLV